MPTVDIRIQEARGAYDANFNKEAIREPSFGLTMAAKNSELLNEQNKTLLENSWDNPSVAIPVINKVTATVNTGMPGCNITPGTNDATMVRPTFFELHVTLGLSDVFADNLEFDRMVLLGRQIRDAELALAAELETRLFTLLDTNKASAYNSGLTGAGNIYPIAGAALQVAGVNQDRFLFDFPSILANDDFDTTNLDLIATPEFDRWMNYNLNQGSGNNQNLATQYAGFTHYRSRFITKTAATNAITTGFFLPKNTIGYYGRVGGSYAKGSSVGTSRDWGTFNSELLGLPVMFQRVESCIDESTNTGNSLNTSAKGEVWSFAISVAMFTPHTNGIPNSAIKKFDYIP